MHWTLALERAAAPGSWALFADSELRATAAFSEEGSYRAPGWADELRTAIDAAGLEPAALGQLVVGLGPGSFSGIRAAIALLQGVALPYKLPLYGVATAAALAYAVWPSPGQETAAGATEAATTRPCDCEVPESVAVVGDARRQLLLCATYRRGASGELLLAASGQPPRHDNSDFLLVPRSQVAAQLELPALVLSPDAGRLSGVVAAQAVHPDAVALGRLFLSAPAQARLEPLQIYHPAVGAGG